MWKSWKQLARENRALRDENESLVLELRRLQAAETAAVESVRGLAQQEQLKPRELLVALGREGPDSLLLRTFRAMIRERWRIAATACQGMDQANREYHAGGGFYLDELEHTLLELWQQARKTVAKGHKSVS